MTALFIAYDNVADTKVLSSIVGCLDPEFSNLPCLYSRFC